MCIRDRFTGDSFSQEGRDGQNTVTFEFRRGKVRAERMEPQPSHLRRLLPSDATELGGQSFHGAAAPFVQRMHSKAWQVIEEVPAHPDGALL